MKPLTQFLTLTLIFTTCFGLFTPIQEAQAASWYNASWNYRIKLTIDNTKVDADLTNFPVYVDLADLPADFHTNVRTDGGDIRITTADGTTEVPREVVFYNAATNTGELHFKAPSLANATNTEFYLYYGNTAATEPATDATYGAEGVWSNGYAGVWHLKDGTALSGNDSTQYANNGTLSSPTATAGKVDGAALFNGTSDFIDLGRTASLNQTTAWTLQAWAYPTSAPQGAGVISEAYNGTEGSASDMDVQYELGFGMDEAPGGSSKLKVGFYNGTWNFVEDSGNIPINQWVHTAGTWDGTTLTLFKDGNSIGSTTPGSSVPSGSGKFFIGRRHDNAGSVNMFPGILDEVRISSSSRNAAWLSTEYHNQNSPSTFYSTGTQEGGGEIVVPARVLRLTGGMRLMGGLRLR